MKPLVGILIGKAITYKVADTWRTLSTEELNIEDWVLEIAGSVPQRMRKKMVLVFEPEALAHQAVDVPRVGRQKFASLSKVRADHAVVLSETFGWGIEGAAETPSGSFATILHFELSPELIRIRDSFARVGTKLIAAWSAFSVGFVCANGGARKQPSRQLLLIGQDFVGVASFSAGRTTIRRWYGPMTEIDWKSAASLLGLGEIRHSQMAGDAHSRRGRLIVVTGDRSGGPCPFWPQLLASGRLDNICDWDSFAAASLRMSPGLPSNLLTAFPTAIDLNEWFDIGIALSLVAVALLTVDIGRRRSRITESQREHQSRMSQSEAKLGEIRATRQERDMSDLRSLKQAANRDRNRAGALTRLTAIVPIEMTLSHLAIGADDAFEIIANITPAVDLQGFRRDLLDAGFRPMKLGGWSESDDGRQLTVKGSYGTAIVNK